MAGVGLKEKVGGWLRLNTPAYPKGGFPEQKYTWSFLARIGTSSIVSFPTIGRLTCLVDPLIVFTSDLHEIVLGDPGPEDVQLVFVSTLQFLEQKIKQT